MIFQAAKADCYLKWDFSGCFSCLIVMYLHQKSFIMEKAIALDLLNQAQVQHLKSLNNKLKIRFWLFWKLPAAWFMGVRVKQVTAEKSEIILPFSWFSQNPFRSIYFAAQCSAGEFSTGVLALTAIAGRGDFSMLVTHIETDFFKKANSKTVFTCDEGERVFDTIEKCVQTLESQTIVMTARGVQETGELVSIVKITWTFKLRKKN